jgi:4-amino-4-deoxy-L-arabinose transferase-like glycosyltransferase
MDSSGSQVKIHKYIRTALWWLSAFGISLLLSLIDPREKSISGYFAYLVISGIALTILWVSWKSIQKFDPPGWLFKVVILAFALRLFIGIGLTLGLPKYGYTDSIPHQAGYLYQDSHSRDTDAWNLARSDEPLITAWRDSDLSDQYGGLLYCSALIYRVLSPDVRRPMLVLLLTASIGSLVVLFTWVFSQQRLGIKAAVFASWIVALYPEAALLSASHMREPFLISGLSLALAGYVRWRAQDNRTGLQYILAGILLALIVSPPYTVILLGLILGAWLWEGRGESERKAFAVSMILLLGFIAVFLTIRAWSRIEGRPDGNAIELVLWWLTGGAEYQLQVLQAESGWVTKVFGLVPEWCQMPLATFYGLLQPFLPAAVMDSTSVPLIRAVVSFRALGWFFLLPFLVCAPFVALKQSGWRSLPTYLAVLVWVTALFVSYRDAGRLWDNPRWRTVFLCAQAALAGWSWITFRRTKNRWLGRVIITEIFALLALLHWEAGRYYGTPRLNLWETLGLIGGFAVIYYVSSLLYDRRQERIRMLPE